MIKTILLYGQESLRLNSTEVKKNVDISELITNLWDSMYNAEGAGLAAPQIGVNKKVFVIDIKSENFKKVFINPIINYESGEYYIMNEGCLSLPGLEGSVVRKGTIDITYYDENWNLHNEEYDGLLARVIQHEYDHLDGILWVDKIGADQGFQLIPELRKIKNREIKVSYPIS